MSKPKAPTGLMRELPLPIDELVPNPRNPRRHPAEQLDMLRASIRRFGQPKRVLAREANKMLIAGHGISEAMRLEGRTEIQVTLWDVDQATADAFMLADNQLVASGQDDADRIRVLLAEIEEADWGAVGFNADDAAAILEDAVKPLDVEEIATSAVADRFWISVRGPLAKQASALKALQEIMAKFPEVEVELGTTAVAV